MRSHFLRARSKGLVYVGGASGASADPFATIDISLTGLTGGIASSPSAGDIIIVVNAISASADQASGVTTAGYTELVDIAGNDTYDANLSVSYKLSDGSETTVSVLTANENVSDYGAVGIVHVWRGVNQTTPIDVTTTTATAGNGGQPNVPSITPVTAGAVILGCGAGSGTNASIAFLTATGLNHVVSERQTALISACVGIIAAYTDWTSGAYDMAQFGGGSTSLSTSWAAAAVVLRPA